VAPQDPELPARVKPVEVTFAERKTQYLDFRAGVSTGQGARFGLSYGYRNLFGTAMSLTLAAQFGYQFFFLDDEVERRFQSLSLQDRLERRVSASLGIPYIGLPSVRTTLGLIHQRENERNFGLSRNSIDLTFAWRAHRTVNVQFSGDVENNDVDVLGGESYEDILEATSGDPRLRSLLRVPEGASTLVAAEISATLDRRDSPFVPTRGFLLTASTEWARTIRSEAIERFDEITRFYSHHLRFQLSGSGYVPFGPRNRFVFATQLKIGRVVHLEDRSDTYPNRQFFVGGVGSMRGYLQDAMVPQDLAEEIERNPELGSALVQGGDTFLVVRGEMRFPIAGDLRGGAFVDFGNLWIEPGQLNPLELRPTAGLGLRIGTPVGPIALDYGILLARRKFLGEPFGSFHFSIGLF
jgi:outer membrane protein assembly factor BamA